MCCVRLRSNPQESCSVLTYIQRTFIMSYSLRYVQLNSQNAMHFRVIFRFTCTNNHFHIIVDRGFLTKERDIGRTCLYWCLEFSRQLNIQNAMQYRVLFRFTCTDNHFHIIWIWAESIVRHRIFWMRVPNKSGYITVYVSLSNTGMIQSQFLTTSCLVVVRFF